MTAPPPPPPAPPPPPPAPPPPSVPERDEPGFLACGGLVFAGLIGLSAVAGIVSTIVEDATWVPAAVGITAVVVAVFVSIRDPRVGRCILKGLATVIAAGAVLFGVCVAILVAAFN